MKYQSDEDLSPSKSPRFVPDVLVTNLLCFSTVLISLLLMSFVFYGLGWLDVVAQKLGVLSFLSLTGDGLTGKDLLGIIFATDIILIVTISYVISDKRVKEKVENLFGIRKIDVSPYKSQKKDQTH